MLAASASPELIAKLVGHTTTKPIERVRRKLRPVITGGAEISLVSTARHAL
jgi:hypothetical protein